MRRTPPAVAALLLAGFAFALRPAPSGLGSDDPRAQPLSTYLDPHTGGRVPITRGDYQDFLLELYGAGELPNLLYRRLLEAEARRLGLEVSPATSEQHARAEWEGFVSVRFGGNEAAAAAELRERGFTVEHYLGRLLGISRQTLLEDAIARATRVIDPAAVKARFDDLFGVDGVRVEVRHVFLNRARMQQELIRAGRAPESLTPRVIDLEIQARLEGLLKELREGADFAAIAERESHDLASKARAGRIEGYNYDRFGEPLAQAVRAAEVGVPFGPVNGAAGWHLGLVDSRTTTSFEEHKSTLEAQLAAEPASPLERGGLRQRLLTQAEAETP